jgi:DNA-binding MarR family transcriptional regulator
MERRGLIHREDCPTDNRGAEVVLTGDGLDAFRRSSLPHLRAIRELFVDALTPDQLAAAGDVARSLRRHQAKNGQEEPGD